MIVNGRSRLVGTLGVILASSTVPRVAGEIGDANSMPSGTLFETIRFEDFRAEMRDGLRPASLERLIECRNRLVTAGADCIATSCGLLWPAQQLLQMGCPVPVVSSSLTLVDRLRIEIPQGLCVVTAELDILPRWTDALAQLQGIDFCELGRDSYLYQALTGKIPAASFEKDTARDTVVECVAAYLADHPSTRAILLECTNLSPYKDAIARCCGLPVYDIFSAVAIGCEVGLAVGEW